MIQIPQPVRRLFRVPGFTLTSVLTLAIGIGATTAIFSVVNAILLEPLPFPESEHLVALTHRSAQTEQIALPASTAIYFTYRDNNRAFESVSLWTADTAAVTGVGDPEEVRIVEATHDFLPTLRVTPALGRAFSATDDEPGSERTAILSHDYWQRRFGGAESALGQSLVVDGVPHAVIGVLPRRFRFLRQDAELLLPMQPDRAISWVGPLGENGIARLRDGVTLADANADIERMIPILMETFPPVPGVDMQVFRNLRLSPDLEYLKEAIVGDLDDVLWVLMGTIGMLLLVACANVANLQLVRTEGRGQELAIQAALGASRGRIIRNLLDESVLLGLAGGALGLVFAWLGLPLLLEAAAGELPGVLDVTLDETALAFALAVSLVSGILFGTVPALRYSSPRVAAMLSGGGSAHSGSRDRHRARQALIVMQVALALVLLVASGLMIRTFESLRDVDPGFVAPERVLTVSVSLPQASVPDFARAIRAFNDMQDRLAEVPGAQSVGFGSRVPLGGSGPSSGFFVEDSSLAEDLAPPISEFRYTSPHFFETLGTPLVAGRTFEWTDDYDSRPVAVVSENMARREWGTPAAALGKRLRMTSAEPWREIVGVVGDIRHEALEQPAPSTVYLTLGEPFAQYMSRTVTFAIRSERVGTAGFLEDIQRAIWSVDATVPLASVQTLDELYDYAMARTALTLVLLAITATMALLLGLVGIYGVISYMLSQRTREIGIRMALGAQNAALKRLLLNRVLMLVVAGVVLGLGGATVLARLMESLLFGVTALDPLTYVAVSAVVIATALLAAYLSALRVTHVDPVSALRAG